MKRKNKSILIILVIIALLPLLGWAGVKGYVYYAQNKYIHDLKEPYIEDAKNSLGGETPMDAYHEFRQALKNDDQEKALKYLFKGSRKEYGNKLKNPEIKKNILDMPQELQKESESKCTGETIACQRKAYFYYKYKVEGPRKEHDLGEGYKAVREPGIHKNKIIFIKNLLGKWQIEQI